MVTPTPSYGALPRRPHYRKQQVLTAEQLNGAHEYQAEQMRRLVHGLAGFGVVYGFHVAPSGKDNCAPCIKIGCGLAFDRHGRQLFWPGGSLSANDFIAGDLADKECYLICVHYAEHRIKAPMLEDCGEEAVQWIEESVRFSFVPLPQGSKEQGSGQDDCRSTNDGCEPLGNLCISLRGYVCDRLIRDDLCPEEPGKLCATGDDEWWYDHNDGIALARVAVCDLGKGCDPRFGFSQDRELCDSENGELCDVRPFVYRNPLLFDLTRACHVDLVHVDQVRSPGHSNLDPWPKHPESISWSDFVRIVLETGIQVQFSESVHSATLNDASVFLTAIVEEPESYFRDVLRIPVRMEFLDKDGNPITRNSESEASVPVWGVHLDLGKDSDNNERHIHWIQRQIEDRKSRFAENEKGSLIELTIRTSLIRDHCDPPRLLDGRPLDIPKDDPAQAMPGVDFVAALFVAQWSEQQDTSRSTVLDKPAQVSE